MEREAQLLEWRLTLTEERNAVMVPSAGSGIPGAPAEWYDTWQEVSAIVSNLVYLINFDYLNLLVCLQGSPARHGDTHSCRLSEPETYVSFFC